MAEIFGHVIELNERQVEQLLDITGNDRIKTLRVLNLLHQYGDYIENKIIDENAMQHRNNYTGSYVRQYFKKYVLKHKTELKMKQIENVSLELGISSKAVEKHIYKK